MLYHFEEFSYEEIAARTGVSLAKVKTGHAARPGRDGVPIEAKRHRTMNPSLETEEKVGRLLDRAGRATPLRRAPASLESRVLVELERRAALPWWRHSFERWPAVARSAFLVTCGVLAVLALTGGFWAVSNLAPAQKLSGLPPLWARHAFTLAGIAGDLAATLVDLIPPAWIYRGLVASALLYAALFGLSVAAYRMLYVRTGSGDFSS